MENEADTAEMNGDAVEMDDDSKDKLLEGKDYNGFVLKRVRTFMVSILFQDMMNNYLRVKSINQMKSNKPNVRNEESN